MDRNKNVAVALLDLSKAFDSTDHKFHKLKLNGQSFSESAIELIYNFISNMV